MRLIRKLFLKMNPPRRGDVYYRSWLDFIKLTPFKQRLFQSRDSFYEFIPGEHSYRYTITSDGMPYYICKVEIWVTDYGFTKPYWLECSVPGRIFKGQFIDMILSGKFVKANRRSF